MNRRYGKKWIEFSFVIVALLLGGIFGWTLFTRVGQVAAEVKDPAVANVEFKVGQVSRTANNYEDGVYTYSADESYLSGTLPTTLSNEQTTMLRNYDAQNALLLGSGVQQIQNIYLSFGTPYEIAYENLDALQGETYGDHGLLLKFLTVSAKLNDTSITINNITTETQPTVLPGDNTANFYYWYDYLDLTNITDLAYGNPITQTEGLYTFTFTYSYLVKNGSSYQLVGPYTYTFSFYLLNETTYADNYPLLTDATVGNKDAGNIEQYYYHYESSNLPTISYDPTLYNLSYSRTKDNTTETVTTSFSKNPDTSGLLTVTSSLTGTESITIANVAGTYTAEFTYDELGTYTFLIRYVLYTPSGYRVISNTELPAYDITRVVEGQNPYTIENGLSKSYYKLHIFGVRSYFNKNNTATLLQNGTISADYTAKISGLTAVQKGYYASVNDGLFPSTNLPPVSFQNYGTYLYNSTTPISKIYRYTSVPTADATPVTSYFTKNTQLSTSGYYEVVIAYTYDMYNVGESGNSQTVFYQAFVFRIDMSTPTVTLKTTSVSSPNSGDATLSTSAYTNQNVYASFTTPSYFKQPLTVTLTKRNYDLTGATTSTLTQTAVSGTSTTALTTVNGNYLLKVYYSTNSALYVEYGFVIDKNPVSDVAVAAIDKISLTNPNNDDWYVINDSDVVDFTSNIVNQPFTLTYAQKASGASITTTYQKIPFTANALGGSSIDSGSYQNYITTTQSINYTAISSALEYVLDYSVLTTGMVSANNVFKETSSFIYLFTITDQAGNVTKQAVIYDLTTPQVVISPTIDNPYNIVSSDTTLFWGTTKAVLLANSNTEITHADFKSLVQNNTDLFEYINGYYYFVSPVLKVEFTNNSTSATWSFVKNESSWATGVTILAQTPTTPTPLQLFFSGEKSYTYSVSDSSNLSSSANTAKNTALKSNIWMNLDNSLAIVYGKNFSATGSTTTYGEALDWNKQTTNSNQLRLTYRPGETGTDYEVKSFTYTYYEFAPSNYTSIATALNTSYTPEQNEPTATYPFNTTPSIINRSVSISSLTIPGQTEGSNLRVVSEVINAITKDGQIVTKEGMYVFRREYRLAVSGTSNDTTVRFYVFYVDRDKIINIAGDATDEDIATLTNPSASSILYQTGSGIGFKFTTSDSDTTRYSSKQIQQYLSYVGNVALFDSNKLPVKLTLPGDKYNTTQTLLKSPDASSYASTISAAASKNLFGLKYVIKYGSTNRIIADSLNNNLNAGSYDSNYVTMTTNSTLNTKQMSFKLAGTYTVTLYTNGSAEVSTSKHPYTTYSFSFTISHESPTGNYYSTYDDDTDKLLTQKTTATNLITYVSTSDDDLKFVFTDNENDYKAKIDANNLSVKRISIAGVTSTIFTRVNGSNSTAGVYSVSTDTEGLNTYTLDLTSFANQTGYADQATYVVTLSFEGNSADYVITSGSSTTNYFTRDFKIVVDRVKPQYNYNQLLTQDALKYNAASVSGLNLTNYFFAINQDFTFRQSTALGSELDSYELFVRPLTVNASTGYPSYYYTITPDNEYYNNAAMLSEHPRFSESESSYANKYTYYIENGTSLIHAQDIFENLVASYGTNYFEVVERDEAGNYQVYAVQYTTTGITPSILLQYQNIGETDTTSDVLSDENKTITISGNNLTISEIQSSDLFMKVIITYNGNNTVIVNNPNTNSPADSFTSFLSAITTAIAFSQTQNASGYYITLTFVNRYDENYVITYLVPGDRQTPIFTNISSTQFRITIPADTSSSYIEQFKVWKFENGAWSTTDLSKDALGTPIRKGEEGGDSLQNQSYVFGVGEYMFQFVDNFGRGADTSVYKPFYYGIGVNNVNEISYGTSQTVGDIVYTASTVTLRYQLNLYELKVYKYVSVDGEMQKTLISDLSQESAISQTTNNTTNVKTLTFNLNTHGSQQQYEISLYFYRTESTSTYRFMLYKKLPTIVLRTLSGSYLNPASSPFTENFLVTWSNDTLDFNAKVNLVRTYTGSDGKLTTQTITNIANGYQVNLIGNYTATITNALNYTNTANNLSFQLVTGSVVVYEVLAINNGIETVLSPSPITATLTVDGMEKVLYKYYALKQYDGSVLNNEIQVRVNTNKALSVSQLDNTVNPNTDSRLYRIYGTGEYGYERYIEIIFVDAETTNANFSNLSVTIPGESEEDPDTTLTLNPSIKTIASSITLTWDGYSPSVSSNNVENTGNILYADYYFNGVFVKTIYRYDELQNSLTLSAAGIYTFNFYDLAGNHQTFNSYSTLTINLINNITYLVNDEEPIDNLIVNNALRLVITNRTLYDSDPVVTAKRDGESITVTRESTSGYAYNFTTQGYYEVTMSTLIRVSGVDQTITTTYHFIIINAQQKLLAFNLPQNYNFTVESLIYEGSDITYTLASTNELWLSQGSTGMGSYVVTLQAYISALETTTTFSFTVVIYDEIPEITASIDFGTSTTNNIDVYYNPYKIYDSLGESILRIRMGDTVVQDIEINADALNEKQTYVIDTTGVYYIEILTKDGKLVTSYKLERAEPLNTTSIIVISVVSVLIVALAVLFIVLRSRVKFR